MHPSAHMILSNSASPNDSIALMWLFRGSNCFLRLSFKFFVSTSLILVIPISNLHLWSYLANTKSVNAHLNFMLLHHRCMPTTDNALAVVSKRNLKSFVSHFLSKPRTFFLILSCSSIFSKTSHKLCQIDGLLISLQVTLPK